MRTLLCGKHCLQGASGLGVRDRFWNTVVNLGSIAGDGRRIFAVSLGPDNNDWDELPFFLQHAILDVSCYVCKRMLVSFFLLLAILSVLLREHILNMVACFIRIVKNSL